MSKVQSWLAALAAVVGVGVALALGFWQLDRAHQKEALVDAIAASRELAPLGPQALDSAQVAALVHRPVVLRGQWMPEHTVFLDNRQMGGKVGFYVATPLRLAGTDRAVIVQRGWVPRNFTERARLPTIETPPGEVQVLGRIAPPPPKLYQLGQAGTGPIRQNLDLAAFSAEIGLPLPLVSVLETSPASQGLLRDWPETGSGPGKNYGYAFQWWALGGLIATLYVWFQFIHPRRHGRPY